LGEGRSIKRGWLWSEFLTVVKQAGKYKNIRKGGVTKG